MTTLKMLYNLQLVFLGVFVFSLGGFGFTFESYPAWAVAFLCTMFGTVPVSLLLAVSRYRLQRNIQAAPAVNTVYNEQEILVLQNLDTLKHQLIGLRRYSDTQIIRDMEKRIIAATQTKWTEDLLKKIELPKSKPS